MSRKTDARLNVAKVMEDFEKSSESSSHHKGTFKMEKAFEEALDTILKAKPELKNRKVKP